MQHGGGFTPVCVCGQYAEQKTSAAGNSYFTCPKARGKCKNSYETLNPGLKSTPYQAPGSQPQSQPQPPPQQNTPLRQANCGVAVHDVNPPSHGFTSSTVVQNLAAAPYYPPLTQQPTGILMRSVGGDVVKSLTKASQLISDNSPEHVIAMINLTTEIHMLREDLHRHLYPKLTKVIKAFDSVQQQNNNSAEEDDPIVEE